jgi:hypothetical protein
MDSNGCLLAIHRRRNDEQKIMTEDLCGPKPRPPTIVGERIQKGMDTLRAP